MAGDPGPGRRSVAFPGTMLGCVMKGCCCKWGFGCGNGGRHGGVDEDLAEAEERRVPINVGSATDRRLEARAAAKEMRHEGRPTQREGRDGCSPAGGWDGTHPAVGTLEGSGICACLGFYIACTQGPDFGHESY